MTVGIRAGSNMELSNAAIIDVAVEPPKHSKRGKGKEPRIHAREFASLEDHVGSLEDVLSRVEEHCSILSQHMGIMEKGQQAMEDSVAAAMESFRQQLEQFRSNLAHRKDERNVLIDDLIARIYEVEDLKLQVAIFERVVARGLEPQREYAPKARVPEPQHFKRTWDEKEIDNFLWHMEHYIKGPLDDEEEKV